MRRLLLLFLLLLPWPATAQASGDIPIVAAAANMQFALDEVVARFRADTGRQVKIAYGSSGNLTRQIEQGAPFQLFISADEDFVYRLADAGLTVDRGTRYALGRLVLFAPHNSPLDPDQGLAGLEQALARGEIKRFAIASPDHAPYGRAAREALTRAGLWTAIEPRLVYGENISQAAQFAASGSAQGGIVAYSLALVPTVAAQGRHALIPAEWHRPLAQRMVMLKSAGATARAFYAYLQTAPARAILARHGYGLPTGDAR